MSPPVRLRQAVLITTELAAVTTQLEELLGLEPGFSDEGVALFGLENRVLAVGDCFVEVLTPVTPDSAGHRYLERHGGDGGYMAIFQFADREAPRRLASEAGARVVWQADLDDIAGTHLDPRDIPGAIVSLDWADPPESWHWAGPAWQGERALGSAARRAGGLRSLEVATRSPDRALQRWAAVLGPSVVRRGRSLVLVEAGQHIDFVGCDRREEEGIVAIGVELAPVAGAAVSLDVEIGGVRILVEPGQPTR